MSRLGKRPIELPEGVACRVETDRIEIKGPKGVLVQLLPAGICVRQEDKLLVIDFDPASGLSFPLYGSMRALIANMVTGVSSGFMKQLLLIGVGYRAVVNGSILDLSLGFSHPVQLAIPKDIRVVIQKNEIKVEGIDKQLVGQFVADIRRLKPPEPYKGKGIRYLGEQVRKKAGKAAKGGK